MPKRLLLFLRLTPDETELKRRAKAAALRIRHRNRAALSAWRAGRATIRVRLAVPQPTEWQRIGY